LKVGEGRTVSLWVCVHKAKTSIKKMLLKVLIPQGLCCLKQVVVAVVKGVSGRGSETWGRFSDRPETRRDDHSIIIMVVYAFRAQQLPTVMLLSSSARD